ncbi:MAG TPA: hypothetical protein VFA98_10165 [Thermoanaerobaculia bacterium]|nr:hypothetical protein [Thermoanaerobaculia bacterium]
MESAFELLRKAQEGLRLRFDDFRRALERRDGPAYRLGLADFQQALDAWTAAEERALLPALDRAAIPGRDARREVTLEFVQLRELTRQLRAQIDGGARMSDVLGLAENLARRFDAHERGLCDVYYPAAAPLLDGAERSALEEAARALA